MMVIFFILFCVSAYSSEYLIQNIRVIDGSGDQGIHSILVQGDRIAAIDPIDISDETVLYDGTGKSVIPGLIDSHVHITMIPGEPFVERDMQQRIERHEQDLKSYLAWGVTSIVDPGITVSDAQLINDIVSQSSAPEVYLIGPLLGPIDGYPSVVSKLEGVNTTQSVQTKLNEFHHLNPLGVKITFEDGPAGSIWPLFEAEMINAIQEECKARDIPTYIHAMDAKMTRMALTMQPHALVHASRDGGKRLAREIVEQDVYVVTTLDIYGSPLIQWNPEMLAHPNVVLTTPQEAIDLIYDPIVSKASQIALVQVNVPWFPQSLYRIILNERMVKYGTRKASAMITKMHGEGVKLVLGSDSGGWPILTYMLHGPTTHLEIDLLYESGLSPLDIIRAATKTPAEMLGISDEVGSIQVGLRADLLIVDGNPLEDINTIHHPIWVVRAGELRTPSGWVNKNEGVQQ
jgi:imidazolonepropionase-like amidohydrolase